MHYFDFHYGCGERWYRAHFVPQAWSDVRGLQTGEASPEYLFCPAAPQRVAAFDPGMKLIVMLRNPVERAYSQYQMSRRRGSETLPFAEALALEPERLEAERRRLGAVAAHARGKSHRHHSYQSRGHYASSLRSGSSGFLRSSFCSSRARRFFAIWRRRTPARSPFWTFPSTV